MSILNSTKQTIIAEKTIVADTLASRMTGLLGRSHLPPEEALLITHCRSIHMFFMKFAIDVIFVSKENKVVGLVENIKPFQMSPIFFKADYAIELAVGVIARSRTEVGDIVEIS